jgi:hypothetical protein
MNSLSFENILGAVGLLSLLVWIAWDMPPAIKRESSTTTIRYTFWVRCFYLFGSFAIPLGLTLLAIVNRPREDEMWCLFLSYALYGILNLPMWWIVTRWGVTISERGLECRSPWRRRRFVTWDEIVDVTYGEVGKWYILRTRDGYRFRVPQQMIPGVHDFLQAVSQHRPEAVRSLLSLVCGTSRLWQVVEEAAKRPANPPPPENA